MPPVYYPPAPVYSMWGYNYPQWPQQAYTTSTEAMQHVTYSDTVAVENESCDASREDVKQAGKAGDIVDGSCNVEKDDIDTSVAISPDISPDSRAREPKLSLSSLKQNYSSSSSSTTTPSPTQHDGSISSSPLDVNNFEQQVKAFTSMRSKVIRNSKASPLSLPSDNRSTGQ